jgi:hypothetical protein
VELKQSGEIQKGLQRDAIELERDMKVELNVDGNDIPLNAFTQEIIGNVAVAMAQSLRGVGQGWKEITIKVQE